MELLEPEALWKSLNDARLQRPHTEGTEMDHLLRLGPRNYRLLLIGVCVCVCLFCLTLALLNKGRVTPGMDSLTGLTGGSKGNRK